MVMNIPFVVDLMLIQDNCQQLIDEHGLCTNDYQPGQEVLKLAYKPDKLVSSRSL
jgi:hypothetical protein